MNTPNAATSGGFTPAGWTFTRVDDRTIEVHCPTFTTPVEVSLNSCDRKVLAFYGLAVDLLEQAAPAASADEALLRQALGSLERYIRWAADLNTEIEAANAISALKSRLGLPLATERTSP